MERLYDQVKETIDNDLKSNFEDIMSKNQIPYLSEEQSIPCYVTFFAANQDINLPKKNMSKYKLSHPKLRLSYSVERYPDFLKLKKSFSSSASIEKSDVIENTPFLFFYNELEPKWRTEITNKVKHWINTIFSKTMMMYKERYSITLGLFIIEMYIETPEKMYITKLPKFQDLTFVTSAKPPVIIDNEDIIKQQVELISNSPFFKGKF